MGFPQNRYTGTPGICERWKGQNRKKKLSTSTVVPSFLLSIQKPWASKVATNSASGFRMFQLEAFFFSLVFAMRGMRGFDKHAFLLLSERRSAWLGIVSVLCFPFSLVSCGIWGWGSLLLTYYPQYLLVLGIDWVQNGILVVTVLGWCIWEMAVQTLSRRRQGLLSRGQGRWWLQGNGLDWCGRRLNHWFEMKNMHLEQSRAEQRW